MRTVTTTIGRDGRVSQHVEERSLGGAQHQESAPQPAPAAGLRDMLRALAAPLIAAATSTAMTVFTRWLMRAAGMFVRALVRRLLGGR